MGTGFLIRRNLLLTNNHVLPSKEVAKDSQIDFDYQTRIDGSYSAHISCKLDQSTFHTNEQHDLSVVGVQLNGHFERKPLELADEPARVHDRVAIIQHPEGGRKQVALHRNFVLSSNSEVLQYITDTLPGSSGSPVFDSRWRVVGVHRANGHVQEPKTGQIVYHNIGTALESVQKCLREWNV
jgi:V8-like Glu-specific endopeptidase